MSNFSEKNDTVSNPQEKPYKVVNLETYIRENMKDEMNDFAKNSNMIPPGLYDMSPDGLLKLTDKFARNGDHIIYFSFFKSPLELTSAILSEIISWQCMITKLTPFQIMKAGSDDRLVQRALKEFASYSENITIVECSYQSTIDEIVAYILNYRKSHDDRPIVMIDNLDAILTKGTENAELNNMCRLKKFQSDNHLVMFSDLHPKPIRLPDFPLF